MRASRVQKHGPVFTSNLFGTKTVVVADFAGYEKVPSSFDFAACVLLCHMRGVLKNQMHVYDYY